MLCNEILEAMKPVQTGSAVRKIRVAMLAHFVTMDLSLSYPAEGKSAGIECFAVPALI